MLAPLTLAEHWNDDAGRPAGGITQGTGFTISWQNGPLGRDDERRDPNGAFVESVIKAAENRLEYYQSTKFRCDHNARALTHLRQALYALNQRTIEREERKVEGTHTT